MLRYSTSTLDEHSPESYRFCSVIFLYFYKLVCSPFPQGTRDLKAFQIRFMNFDIGSFPWHIIIRGLEGSARIVRFQWPSQVRNLRHTIVYGVPSSMSLSEICEKMQVTWPFRPQLCKQKIDTFMSIVLSHTVYPLLL